MLYREEDTSCSEEAREEDEFVTESLKEFITAAADAELLFMLA